MASKVEYGLENPNILLIRLELGEIGTNCYLLADKTAKEMAVIDPAGDFPLLKKVLAGQDLADFTVKYIINTHGHWDHVGANADLAELTGAPILIHAADAKMLEQGADANFRVRFKPSQASRLLADGDELPLGAYTLRVLHTPGHTQGGICLVVTGAAGDELVFAGDTLFQMSIGRTDLPGGDFATLIQSIRTKLLGLKGELPVFPGHGEHTFIADELQYNPFLREK